MRNYQRLGTLGASLGFPSDGKRFGKTLIEVGIRESNGRPTSDTIAREIAVRRGKSNTWLYDTDAVTVRVMGGYCTPHIAMEAEAIGIELTEIDAAFSGTVEGDKLVNLCLKWDNVIRRITPRHVARINGVLRREGTPYRG